MPKQTAKKLIEKGVALGNLGKHAEALKAFEKAIEIDPTYHEAWFNKGVALGDLGKHAEALKALEKAIEIDPSDDEVWFNKGLLLADLEKYEEAVECLIEAYEMIKIANKGQHSVKLTTGQREDEIKINNISSTEKKIVRVALVQIDFQLNFIPPPKDFGYELAHKEEMKKKVFNALKIAEENDVNIICFPELSTDKQWIDQALKQYKDMVIIFGSYYANAFNECPIIIEGQDYYIRKIHPSPHSEKAVGSGRCMKSGKERVVFQTKYGRFVVLICHAFYKEMYSIFNQLDNKNTHVDFVTVPSYNKAVDLYQKRADQACQDDKNPYILIANSLKVDEEEAGGTCIIGVDHKSALKRYENEGCKPKDDIKYKLFEARGECVIIADLDIETKGIPLPAGDFKMREPKTKEIPSNNH